MKLFLRSPIPDRSVLTVLVSTPPGAAGNFVTSGTLRHRGNVVAQWTDAQLRAGINFTLTPVGGYSGEIVINFAANSTARLQMEVQKPNGSKFVYDEQATSGAGVDVTDLLLPVS